MKSREHDRFFDIPANADPELILIVIVISQLLTVF